MNKFGQKGNVSNEDFLIHVLNNLPREDDVILDGLENNLMAIGDNALTIDSICKKLNHTYKTIESKKEKNRKRKSIGCIYKPGDRRCPENKNEKEENNKKTERYEYKNKKFDGVCYHCSQRGHMRKHCLAWKNGHYKKF